MCEVSPAVIAGVAASYLEWNLGASGAISIRKEARGIVEGGLEGKHILMGVPRFGEREALTCESSVVLPHTQVGTLHIGRL